MVMGECMGACNMLNNAVGLSCRQNSSISIGRPMTIALGGHSTMERPKAFVGHILNLFTAVN